MAASAGTSNVRTGEASLAGTAIYPLAGPATSTPGRFTFTSILRYVPSSALLVET